MPILRSKTANSIFHSKRSSNASTTSSCSSSGANRGPVPTSSSGSLVELGEDIIILANYVKSLREALGKIKRVFNVDPSTGQMIKPETRRIQAHEKLGQVLRILRLILEKFPAIRSTELLMAAGNMIKKVKEHKYENEQQDLSDIFDGIDQLAAAFSSRLQRKMETFGSTSQAGKDTIPTIVAKCVMEIDARGVEIKGLYRVSGVKSKVEKLWQAFENGAELVDLSDVHPNVIANVLKLYFRQLPEPLLTFRLYPEFIKVAKEYPSPPQADNQSMASSSSSNSLSTMYNQKELEKIDKLAKVVAKLPRPHFLTLGYLIHHLRRVSDQSAINNMPASNLGIVFGPTLLRTSDGGNSMSSLVDTVHQTRVIDLLITFSAEVFGSPFRVNAQGHVVENLKPVQAGTSINPHVTEVSGQSASFAGGSSREVVAILPTQSAYRDESNTQNVESNNNGQELMVKGITGHYSSTAVITLGGHKISTGNFNPVKSASATTIPVSTTHTVRYTEPTSPDSGDSSSESPSEHPTQRQQMRSDIQELRKQFFMGPAECYTLPCKESSTDGGTTTDEELISSLNASGNHAKLKRSVMSPVVQHDIIDDHNPQYTSRALFSPSPRLRFMETEMLSRSASASSPFSPRPEQSPSPQRPKYV